MLEEFLLPHVVVGPTKEDRIRMMLTTPGWQPVASPFTEEEPEEGEWREPAEAESMDDITKQINTTGLTEQLNTTTSSPDQRSSSCTVACRGASYSN
jgi:hypothetical protein